VLVSNTNREAGAAEAQPKMKRSIHRRDALGQGSGQATYSDGRDEILKLFSLCALCASVVKSESFFKKISASRENFKDSRTNHEIAPGVTFA
jgi:hypothetical protein